MQRLIGLFFVVLLMSACGTMERRNPPGTDRESASTICFRRTLNVEPRGYSVFCTGTENGGGGICYLFKERCTTSIITSPTTSEKKDGGLPPPDSREDQTFL